MKWFKHDTTALHDAKIEKLVMKYGIQGYGLYFACVEIIAGNLTNENITFELEHDAEILAYKFKLDTLLVEEMMKYMCTLGLFETKNNRIFCYKLANRIDSSLIKNTDLLKIKQQIQEDSRRVKKVQDKTSQTRIDKTRIDKNKDIIKQIYNSYPTRCPASDRSTGKSQKCKDKIKSILKDGKTDLLKIIKQYVNECEKNNTYMKNFSTFLNNLPDYKSEYKCLNKNYIRCPKCKYKIIGTIQYCGGCGLDRSDFKSYKKE